VADVNDPPPAAAFRRIISDCTYHNNGSQLSIVEALMATLSFFRAVLTAAHLKELSAKSSDCTAQWHRNKASVERMTPTSLGQNEFRARSDLAPRAFLRTPSKHRQIGRYQPIQKPSVWPNTGGYEFQDRMGIHRTKHLGITTSANGITPSSLHSHRSGIAPDQKSFHWHLNHVVGYSSSSPG